MLASLAHKPTMFVCDMPSHVAQHGNKRFPTMFSPFDGRFSAPTEDNIALAKKDELHIDIPCLDPASWRMHRAEHEYSKRPHPLTGSYSHFCSYDRFHQHNSKKAKEWLRRLDSVLQLRGKINSQVVEELFSQIQRSRFFLNQMSPINHIFIVRLMLHLRNEELNEATKDAMLKRLLPGTALFYDDSQRVVVKGLYAILCCKQIEEYLSTVGVDPELHAIEANSVCEKGSFLLKHVL
jgi:hypothetical protein